VAGTGVDTAASNGFKHPSWLHVDANGTLYVCDQTNNRVQMWTNGATSGVTVAGDSAGNPGSTSILLKQPSIVTFDDNGFMYVSDSQNNRVERYPPSSLTGTMVAGQGGGNSAALNGVNSPTGIDIDNNSNLYIADTGNKRVMLWTPNATTGSILISNNVLNNMYGLVLAPGSSNQVYLSNQGGSNSIYLWTFGASNPDVTLTQVSDTHNTLNNPSGIILDPYSNLYVADRDNKRVVMYCVNSTVGIVVVGATGSTPVLNQPIAVGFDSNLNLYVATDAGDNVVLFALL
jgi:sugar lactone lactonase YvrE